jgi:c-di-GMP-binding flagellar brake protein YcgR
MAPQDLAIQVDADGRRRWINRRAFVRYQCALATAGRVYPEQRQEFHRAWVLDLSRGGAGLLLNRALPLHQEVMLHITSPSGKERLAFPARVVHLTEQVDGDWLIGFEFLVPLTNEHLDILL